VQIKRLHEYKRQLLNAFAVQDTYFGLKDGTITDFTPTVYLFGAKAAPGYFRAKGIIKFINEIAALIRNDAAVSDKMQVLFVSNYNVSYAEKLIPAADISEQISTAGTEASGTGNMKFMLNGALTLGTYDGANIEIVEQAGEENNYIFGARVEELVVLRERYDPKALLESQPRLKRVVETLVDGTFDDGGTGMFRELYTSLTEGASWHKPDHYFLLHDFAAYCDTRLRANRDYRDREAFMCKGVLNMATAGPFSSDRTVRE
jgi:starch phosphorylase